MRAVIWNGARKNEGFVDGIANVLEDVLKGLAYEVRKVKLCEKKVAPCTGDFRCWTRTPGECTIDDDARALAKGIVLSDALVFLTPVTFGGYSSELKKALDRQICLLLPFFKKIDGVMRHPLRYERSPRIVHLGVLQSADLESEGIFKTLADRNMLNFRPPGHAAGFVYYNNGAGMVRRKIEQLLSEAGIVAVKGAAP